MTGPTITSPLPILPPDPRAQLRTAQARLADANRQLESEIAGTERARQTIRDAVAAEEAATAAEANCVAATADWAARGAQGDMGNQPLFAEAEAARSRAYRANLAAKGAEAALKVNVWDDKLGMRSVEITQAEANAREAVQQAEREINAAVAAVLLAELDPTLQRALELHAELIELLPVLCGFSRMCKQNIPFRPGSEEISGEIDHVRALPRFDENQLVRLMQPWVSLGTRLTKDSGAEF